MNIWALSDPHLCFGTPEKSMESFGETWENYSQRIEKNWIDKIKKDDLVLVAGDISWAKKIENAKKDFAFLDNLPGTKVIIKGNHDYWWTSIAKVNENLPPSIFAIQNDSFTINDITIGGTRLWDSPDFNFDNYIDYVPNPKENISRRESEEKSLIIYKRELERLKLSLASLDKDAKIRICMTHYPPIGATLEHNEIVEILKDYKIDICVFGHLHNVYKDKKIFGSKDGIKYVFTSCDYLDFSPIKIL
jgi:uncharacterized protein